MGVTDIDTLIKRVDKNTINEAFQSLSKFLFNFINFIGVLRGALPARLRALEPRVHGLDPEAEDLRAGPGWRGCAKHPTGTWNSL